MTENLNFEKNQGKEREGVTTELVKDVYYPLTEKKTRCSVGWFREIQY